MKDFIMKFEDPAAPEQDLEIIPEAAEEEGAASGTDYSQMLYEYIVSQDAFEAEQQEVIYAAYTEKLDSINTNLQNIYSVLDWILAMLVFFAVYVLFRSVRRWVRILGGFKDVQ